MTVNMGVPRLQPAEIPFESEQYAPSYELSVASTNGDRETVQLGAVSMGNPHAVIRVDNIDSAPVDYLGPRIESHPDFPQRVNVGFMQVVDRKNIRLRVYERGAGETMACGSGACAAVVSGQLQELLDEQVTVQLTGGQLVISWAGKDEPVYMTGPATHVFDGEIEL